MSLPAPQLTEEQKREVLLIVSIGCDRDTAAQYAGACRAALGNAVAADKTFATALSRAEATAELAHMRSVHQAAKDEKNWRVSVWWLERRFPDRYGKRDKQVIGVVQLREFLHSVAGLIAQVVGEEEERKKLLAGLSKLGRTLAEQEPSETEPEGRDGLPTAENEQE